MAAAPPLPWDHACAEDLFCTVLNVPTPYLRGAHIPLEVFMLLTGILLSDGSWCDYRNWPAAWAPAGSLQGAAVSAQPRPKPRHNPWILLPYTSSGPWGGSLVGGEVWERTRWGGRQRRTF